MPNFAEILVVKDINFDHWAKQWLLNWGVSPEWAGTLTLITDVFLLLVISLLIDYIARRLILRVVARYVRRSKNQYDDILLEKRVFRSLAHLLPAIIVYYSLPLVFVDTNFSFPVVQKLLVIYIIFLIAGVVHKFLKALEYIGLQSKRFEGKPVSSYIQVGLIILYIGAAVFAISTVLGKSAVAILTTFGAATAIILLIFRDTILGLVASIQIAANDILRLGDWVSMDKYGADGPVIEINLTTVAVRNWDNTITTVPTYAFISDSFKNWRGMQASGARRIKRSIKIDLGTVRFLNPEMVARYRKYERVREYLEGKEEEINRFNAEKQVNKEEEINGRHLTNLGVFRHYALQYLRENPRLDQNLTLMVRQLQPTEHGVPIEIYCFSASIEWVVYENIQSDIMDHLLAAVRKFDLRIYQSPSGHDLQEAIPLLKS